MRMSGGWRRDESNYDGAAGLRTQHTQPMAAMATREVGGRATVRPLRCPSCGSCVPLGNDPYQSACLYCRTLVPIPPEHQAVREAARARDGDRAAAEQLYQKLGQPPGPWLRAWVGGLSRVVKVSAMILGGVALIWAVLLKLLGSLDTSSDKDNDMGGVLLALVIGIPVAIFFGTAFILAKIVRVVAPVLGVDLIDVWSFSGGFALIGVILFILSIVPYALHQYIDAFAGIRRKIQASLAAQPPSHAGGAACCRNCGAALTVRLPVAAAVR